MSRIARKNLGTSFFHIMSQGINKEWIFSKDKYKQEYIKLMFFAQKNFDIEIIAYCIMSNHFHILLFSKKIENMSKFMQYLNTLYARYYNFHERRIGYVFRDRFRSEPIRDLNYLFQCIKYIHNNPVKANLVERCEEYKYSSYKEYYYKIGVGKGTVLKELFGIKDYLKEIERIRTFNGFIDTDKNEKEILKDYVREYLKSKRTSLKKCKEDMFELKNLLIFVLNQNSFKINDLAEVLGISCWKVKALKKTLKEKQFEKSQLNL